MSTWYETIFDERYVEFYDVLRSGATADRDVDFIERALDLEPGMAILDLGCGQGRHAIPLAERGYRVTGLDLSETMLHRAQRFAHDHSVRVEWVQRRMEDLDGLGPFDAVVCLFTVWGYYGDEGDANVLEHIHHVLRPGGRLMLDLSNYLLQICQDQTAIWRETSTGVTKEQHRYDATTGFLHTERTLFRKAGDKLNLPVSSVRAYQPHEVTRMLHTAGFTPDLIFGSFSDDPYQWTKSQHQIHVALRPNETAKE